MPGAAAADRLIGVESLPPAFGDQGQPLYAWSKVLERKAALAASLDAEWFIHQDADELRESPWPHLSLVEAVALVDRLGFNAIDFEVFNFVPPEGDDLAGKDVMSAARFYQPAAAFDKVQIRCWKKAATQVDLASSGGHEARFPGRRVFPVRFPMRHYPVRSEAHARRKVFLERKPRFDPEEVARGWHVQYDAFVEGRPALPDQASARLFDREAIAVELQVMNRLVEAAGQTLGPGRGSLGEAVTGLEETLGALSGLAARARELEDELARQRAQNVELREANGRLLVERDDLRSRLAASTAYVESLLALIAAANLERERLVRDADDLVRRLDDTHASKSWRLTAPLRAAWRLLGGR